MVLGIIMAALSMPVLKLTLQIWAVIAVKENIALVNAEHGIALIKRCNGSFYEILNMNIILLPFKMILEFNCYPLFLSIHKCIWKSLIR